ncbi:MAG: OFA family MFS transporter, partial [Firmicutes bacterium]|nr:OFA family MFS transporter [Bacillota bacterium]
MLSKGVKVTIAGSITNFFIGTFYSWSVFADGLIYDLHWSKAEASLPYTVEVFIFAIMMFFAGRLQDKIGAGKGVTISGLITGISFLLCALYPTPLSLTVFFGVLYGTGAAFGYASVTPAAIKWFPPEKRGLVTGIV